MNFETKLAKIRRANGALKPGPDDHDPSQVREGIPMLGGPLEAQTPIFWRPFGLHRWGLGRRKISTKPTKLLSFANIPTIARADLALKEASKHKLSIAQGPDVIR